MKIDGDIHWESMEPTPNRRMGRILTSLANLAVFLRENGHINEAIEALKALSWGDPTFESGDYAFELGLCYEAKGNRAEALRFYRVALKENPAVPGRAEAVQRLEF